MTQRLDYAKLDPEARRALIHVEAYVEKSGLELSLLDLVKTRASQINGCAFCLDMHIKDARASGETEERLYMLNAWHEAECYTDRERAALGLTEAVTRVADTHVPNEVYANAAAHFSEKELVQLTMAIIAINSWNRIAITFRKTAGTYQSTRVQTAAGELVK